MKKVLNAASLSHFPDLTALMTSFSVGIISSMRMSGGKPRSSKAGSAKAPASDEEGKHGQLIWWWSSAHNWIFYLDNHGLYPHTFRALAESVGLHAEGGAEALPVTEAGRFRLLRRTFLYRVGVTCELLGCPNRWPCIGKANTLEYTQFLAEIEEGEHSMVNVTITLLWRY